MKKEEKAITPCLPIRIKFLDRDQRREQGRIATDDEKEAGSQTVFVLTGNWFVPGQTDGKPHKTESAPAWNNERALAAPDIREEEQEGPAV